MNRTESDGPRPAEVIGEEPKLSGSRCEALIGEEYWHDGALDVPVNVLWLQAESTWHRLCIDWPVVFWRKPDGPPTAYEMPEIRGSVRLADLGQRLGLVDETFAGIETNRSDQMVEVMIRFRSGRFVALRSDKDDRTDFHTGSLPAGPTIQ